MRKDDILACWKESFSLLKWAEFKLILLASLNNFKRSIVILWKKFWWLWVINLLLFFTIIKIFVSNPYSYWTIILFILGLFLLSVSSILLFYLFFLTTRTSLEPKNYDYYRKYCSFSRMLSFYVTYCCNALVFTVLMLIFLPFIIVIFLPFILVALKNIPSGISASTAQSFFLFLSGFFSSVPCFFSSFFILDSKPTDIFASIKRSLSFYFYFLPFIIVLQFFLLPFMYFCKKFHTSSFILFTAQELFISVMIPISISFAAIIYTKLKHAHHNLFFE